MEIRGVPTYVHWSVFAISAFILTNAASHPSLSILGLFCYYSVLLIHEAGHLYSAQRKGCQVQSIELYPVFGLTRFDSPWSKLDHFVIAWSGVIAQAVVFGPPIAWITVFGATRFGAVNMIFAILGFFSLGWRSSIVAHSTPGWLDCMADFPRALNRTKKKNPAYANVSLAPEKSCHPEKT